MISKYLSKGKRAKARRAKGIVHTHNIPNGKTFRIGKGYCEEIIQ